VKGSKNVQDVWLQIGKEDEEKNQKENQEEINANT
jgi:hypothetical protein